MPGKTNREPTPFEKYRADFKRKIRPEDKEPRMPTNISSFTSEKLGDLMTKYTAWREYAEDCTQDAFVDFMQSKQQHDYSWNLMFLRTPGKSIKDREMVVDCDPKIKVLADSLADDELYHQLLLNKLESFTNCLTVISREISRRSN